MDAAPFAPSGRARSSPARRRFWCSLLRRTDAQWESFSAGSSSASCCLSSRSSLPSWRSAARAGAEAPGRAMRASRRWRSRSGDFSIASLRSSSGAARGSPLSSLLPLPLSARHRSSPVRRPRSRCPSRAPRCPGPNRPRWRARAWRSPPRRPCPLPAQDPLPPGPRAAHRRAVDDVDRCHRHPLRNRFLPQVVIRE